jgi:glutamate formiminotransferase / formiminotetrahydrofolate cyclodeaminase
MKWLECVPNFSEGREHAIIEAIAAAIRSVDGVRLLHVDPGYDANRTVYTFAGEPAVVEEAAFKAIVKASELIDMQQHHGAHPRIGACDVCPIIPLGDSTVAEANAVAQHLGQRLGQMGIPVYMYEHSAQIPLRKNLAQIRKGEYEGLREKLLSKDWQPDFGPAEFQARFGAMVLGARDFLVAYNINLDTKDVGKAKHIAARLRESGYKDDQGRQIPGLLKGVKAIGWWMDAYACAQVSTNIVDIDAVSIRAVYDTVDALAHKLGCAAKGSELIGLIPEKVLLQAGQTLLPGNSDKHQILHAAIEFLGLNIRPEERVLEYLLRE